MRENKIQKTSSSQVRRTNEPFFSKRKPDSPFFQSAKNKLTSTPNNVSLIQRSLTPPGNCNQGEHDKMQKTVKSWCDHSSGRKCSENDSCKRLRQKNKRNERCATSRKKINDKCYNGGDLGHRTAERNAREAQSSCTKISRDKKCW